MELTLNIYTTKFCRTIERTATAQEFELSLGICEDVLDVLNIDMWEGGLSSLSNESVINLVLPIVKNGFPFFKEMFMEIFELSEEEIRRTKITDVAKIVVAIVKYSVVQLKTLAGEDQKN